MLGRTMLDLCQIYYMSMSQKVRPFVLKDISTIFKVRNDGVGLLITLTNGH